MLNVNLIYCEIVKWVMEEKLQSYRLRKRRTETVQSIKEKFAKVMSFVATSTTSVANIEKPTHINIEVTTVVYK